LSERREPSFGLQTSAASGLAELHIESKYGFFISALAEKYPMSWAGNAVNGSKSAEPLSTNVYLLAAHN
jgi:hypothetical protein